MAWRSELKVPLPTVSKAVMAFTVVLLFALPFSNASAQVADDDGAECRRGVLVEGRCLSIDGRAEVCVDDACIEFVESSVLACPEPSLLAADGTCKIVRPATQRPDRCPEGSRGEANGCFIFVAIGPDGCPTNAIEDVDGMCRRAVANSRGGYRCEDTEDQLNGLDCIATVAWELSPCPAGTTRFSDACWNLPAGLTAPERCDGHGVDATIVLDSGRCKVPEAIPTGPETCAGATVFLEGLAAVIVRTDGTEIDGLQTPAIGCVQPGTNGGTGVVVCTFPGERGWSELSFFGEPDTCGRFSPPTVLTCLDGYSFDDFVGGQCARFEPAEDGVDCAPEAERIRSNCVFVTDYEAFECAAGTERFYERTWCAERRPMQNTFYCVGVFERLNGGPVYGYGCRVLRGPQPDTCNAIGTVDDCFDVVEPVATECLADSGCIDLGDFSILGDVNCDAAVDIIDALAIAQFASRIRTDAASCPLGGPVAEIFAFDGDVTGDGAVNIVDALRVARCVTGAEFGAACPPGSGPDF